MQSDWTRAAEAAISLCENWAQAASAKLAGRFFLFGSAIYKGGVQFDSITSDLDIVYVFPNDLSVIDRYNSLLELKTLKQRLELSMIPALLRQACDEPGVSVVPITELELVCNIHKSGARSFFDKNLFYDLLSKTEHVSIDNAGTQTLPDENRQAVEYVQRVRNDFLSVCANNTGGLKTYFGRDPLPKALLRSAAQIAPGISNGEWYDTRSGLEFLHFILTQKRTDATEYAELFEKISIRRGGRGIPEGLTGNDQLLLAEILFELAQNIPTQDLVTWEIQINSEHSEESVRKTYSAVQRIVPDAKLTGHRFGSVILTLRSSKQSFELIEQLYELNVLSSVLGSEVVLLHLSTNEQQPTQITKHARLEHVLSILSSWEPPADYSHHMTERALISHLMKRISEDAGLDGCTLVREPKMTDNFIIDFVLSWHKEGDSEEIGLELTRLHRRSMFFRTIEQLLPVPFPVILLLTGRTEILKSLQSDIESLRLTAPHIHVISIDGPYDNGKLHTS